MSPYIPTALPIRDFATGDTKETEPTFGVRAVPLPRYDILYAPAVGASNPSLPEYLHPRGLSERFAGIGSHLPIQNDRNSRNKLVQEVEVADIRCQHAGTDTPRLKVDERIVEVFPLMTRTLRRAAQARARPQAFPLRPTSPIRSLQAMPRNIFNHIPYRLQNPTRGGVSWIEPPEHKH